MGENPKYIFTVGNTSLDGIKNIETIKKEILSKKYKIDLTKHFIVILQHTVTSEITSIEKNFLKTIHAVKEINIPSLFIFGNADAGSKQISELLKNSKIEQYPSVPYSDYINILKHASALVGNSSSGIIEAPFLHIPTVNIGTRQTGRLRSESIIDVNYSKNDIKKAIIQSIHDEKFLKKVKNSKSFYGKGDSAKKIVRILEQIDLNKIPIQKTMMY